MAEELDSVASSMNLQLPVLAPVASSFALSGSDVLLLVGVVGGGLLVTWLVLQLVLRETAAFSKHFPRDEAPSNAATSAQDHDALAAQAHPLHGHDPAHPSRHDAHEAGCDEPGPHVHSDGCAHDGSIGFDAPGPATGDGAR